MYRGFPDIDNMDSYATYKAQCREEEDDRSCAFDPEFLFGGKENVGNIEIKTFA